MGSSRSPYCFTPDSGRVCRGNACLSLTTLERIMPPSAITDSMSARSSRLTEPLAGARGDGAIIKPTVDAIRAKLDTLATG